MEIKTWSQEFCAQPMRKQFTNFPALPLEPVSIIQNERIKQKSKVFILDIEIMWSGFKLSNSVDSSFAFLRKSKLSLGLWFFGWPKNNCVLFPISRKPIGTFFKTYQKVAKSQTSNCHQQGPMPHHVFTSTENHKSFFKFFNLFC